MKKNVFISIALAVFAQSALIASSAPAQKLPPILMARYYKVQKKLHDAHTLTPALRAEALDAIKLLPKDSAQAKELDEMLRKFAQPNLEQPQQPKAEEIKEAKEKEAASKIIPVGGRKKGSINLDDVESISGETFGEILERQEEHGDPMVIAQVFTFDPDTGALDAHYYDAHNFNVWRFGKDYPLSGDLTIVHQNNPNNNLPLQGDAQYFIYDPKKPELGFRHAFSEADFKNKPEDRLKVDESQNWDAARKKEAKERRAGEWVREPIPQVEEILLPMGAPAAIPPVHVPLVEEAILPASDELWARMYQAQDPIKWATEQIELGDRYLGMGEYTRARQYYESAANQTAAPFARINGLSRLANIYLNGRGVPRDLARSSGYLEQVVNQGVHPLAKWRALRLLEDIANEEGRLNAAFYWRERWEAMDQEGKERAQGRAQEEKKENEAQAAVPSAGATALKIGQEYYYGTAGRDQSYVQARRYYEEAANQDSDPTTQAQAQYSLGHLYYTGQGVARDYKRAGYYFRAAARQNINEFARANAKLDLGKMWLNGEGVDRDLEVARDYFQQALASKNPSAHVRGNAESGLADIEKLEAQAREKSKNKAESNRASQDKLQKDLIVTRLGRLIGMVRDSDLASAAKQNIVKQIQNVLDLLRMQEYTRDVLEIAKELLREINPTVSVKGATMALLLNPIIVLIDQDIKQMGGPSSEFSLK